MHGCQTVDFVDVWIRFSSKRRDRDCDISVMFMLANCCFSWCRWRGQGSEGPLFLRIVRAAGGQGVKHEYVRVVEAYRENGKTRHRTVLNLGRKDLLAAHLDLAKLTRLLHGEAFPEPVIRREDVHAVAAWDFGPMLAARHLWCELGLEATLDRLDEGRRRDGAGLSDRAVVLIANRLAASSSERGV